jgi:hypothetical protein
VKVRSPWNLAWAAGIAVYATLRRVTGHDADELGIVLFAVAAANVASAFLVTPRAAEARDPLGPGPLARTPSGRFRASGWPPSKDVDDYR